MDASPLSAAQERRGSPERVKAFGDGVFAIIITILVLEIGVPPNLSEQSLRDALDELGPDLIAWVVSFLITGMYWV
ncbi:MAG: TMEM175 family protein, partial [Jiangellales bacterium]